MINELRGQFELAWALTDLHLTALVEGDFLWKPVNLVWTVHVDDSGHWWPDWAETEPDPIPVPTIGWVTWHMIFWWSTALAHLHGRPVPQRTEIDWPGPSGSVERLRELSAQWRDLLATLTPTDLAAPSAFPWGAGSGRTVADTTLWLHVELTKNAAEIGQLRMLRAVAENHQLLR
ncbi:DinB family protein [Mycobacterium sp. 21AC1]|uniref:DinB family protein n=1 Tax=[Mycobacterium] appelbergii TaxID=2939269 RepID=UPI0029390E16|nr:DinB family protein [Mycobacterium sp. 21AC1]MDV3130296.1 DinB family protein [Mycobacterium sp. 21AC1]